MSEVVIDVQEFLDRVQDDRDLLKELLDIFVEDFRPKRQTLGTAVSSKNFEQIKEVAHSLKGASGNISAKALRVIILQIENAGKEQVIDGVDQLLVAMDKEFELLVQRAAEVKAEL